MSRGRRAAKRLGGVRPAALGQRPLVIVLPDTGLGLGVTNEEEAAHGANCSRAGRARARKLAPRRGSRRFNADGLRSPFPAAQEGELLEQVHVLLVLEQGAVQRRDQLLGVALAQARAKCPR